jgi:hypothetical protein
MATDTSAKGLETLIVRHMTGTDGAATMRPMFMPEPPPFDEMTLAFTTNCAPSMGAFLRVKVPS